MKDDPGRQYFNAGIYCMIPGLLLALTGGVRTLGFLRTVHTYQQISARELILKLIVPHMVLLTGMGLMTAAVVLLVRTAIIRTRSRHEEI